MTPQLKVLSMTVRPGSRYCILMSIQRIRDAIDFGYIGGTFSMIYLEYRILSLYQYPTNHGQLNTGANGSDLPLYIIQSLEVISAQGPESGPFTLATFNSLFMLPPGQIEVESFFLFGLSQAHIRFHLHIQLPFPTSRSSFIFSPWCRRFLGTLHCSFVPSSEYIAQGM